MIDRPAAQRTCNTASRTRTADGATVDAIRSATTLPARPPTVPMAAMRPKRRARAAWIEALRNERPEAGQQHGADAGQMEINEDGGPAAGVVPDPFEHVSRRTQREAGCDDANGGKRAMSREKAGTSRPVNTAVPTVISGSAVAGHAVRKVASRSALEAIWCATMIVAVAIATRIRARFTESLYPTGFQRQARDAVRQVPARGTLTFA